VADLKSDGGDALHPGAPRLRSPQPSGTATCERVEDTIALGSQLGQQLRAGDVVVLSGPLGAGKTVLAKGIAAAMDVDGPVTSPTYVLARVHPARRAGAPAMIHVDVYRLLDHQGADLLGELDSLDLDSDLENAVVVVEWGEGLAERLSERHLDIRLERVSDCDVRIATWKWSRS
jgi:tRNA threonylcarbamoyladenosine biosynthesis protein TsaE